QAQPRTRIETQHFFQMDTSSTRRLIRSLGMDGTLPVEWRLGATESKAATTRPATAASTVSRRNHSIMHNAQRLPRQEDMRRGDIQLMHMHGPRLNPMHRMWWPRNRNLRLRLQRRSVQETRSLQQLRRQQ